MSDTDDTPPADELGLLRAEHWAGSTLHQLVLASAAFVAVGSAGVAYGLGYASRFGPEPVVIAQFTVFAAVYGIAAVWLAAALRHRVRVHEHGFALVTARRTRVVLWRDIASVREDFQGPIGEPFRVRTWDGRRVRLGRRFRDFAGLAEALRSGANGALLPAAEVELAAGNGWAFDPEGWRTRPGRGGLTPYPDGLFDGRDFLPWAEVRSITVGHPRSVWYVVVRRRGGSAAWYTCRTSAFPNVDLFFALADRYRDGRAA